MEPLILLDVDGVLNPMRRPSFRFRRYACVLDGASYRILLDRRHGHWLLALAAETDATLVWATTWERYANEEISPVLGLPELPVISVAAAIASQVSEMGEHFKTRAVAEYVQGRPFVWFDDTLNGADKAYLESQPGVGDFLLIDVDPRIGLTEQQVVEARGWLLSARS